MPTDERPFRIFDALEIVRLENDLNERPPYYSETGCKAIRVGDVGVKIGNWLGDKVRVECLAPNGAIQWQDHLPIADLKRVKTTAAPYCRRRIHETWAWRLALNGEMLSESDHAYALDLARKVMMFARLNVETLIQRLTETDYRFVSHTPHALPEAGLEPAFRELSERGVHLPIALQAWLLEVGQVDLRGSHPDWEYSAYYGMDERDDDAEPWYSDPLVVTVDVEALGRAEDAEGVVEIAPDAVTKANISGGGPINFSTTAPTFDGVLIGQHGSFTLHSYLQHAFAWGGFPVLSMSRTLLNKCLTSWLRDLSACDSVD